MIAVLNGFGYAPLPSNGSGGSTYTDSEYIPEGRSSAGSYRPPPANTGGGGSNAAASNEQPKKPFDFVRAGLFVAGGLVGAYILWELFKTGNDGKKD